MIGCRIASDIFMIPIVSVGYEIVRVKHHSLGLRWVDEYFFKTTTVLGVVA